METNADGYWARVKEAEENADRAQDIAAKRTWREVASTLRQLGRGRRASPRAGGRAALTIHKLIGRDRDSVYGDVFTRRLRAMGIRDRLTALRSPRQNSYCERLIGSIRRECLDHIRAFGERHLRDLLRAYANYYNEARTHLPLGKDSSASRATGSGFSLRQAHGQS